MCSWEWCALGRQTDTVPQSKENLGSSAKESVLHPLNSGVLISSQA